MSRLIRLTQLSCKIFDFN